MYKLFLNRYSQILAFSGCSVSLGFVIFGRKYIDRYRIYKTMGVENSKPLFCDVNLEKLLMQVGNKMGISDDDLKRVILYHTSFDSPIHKGCLNLPFMSWLPKSLIPNAGIGLPINFKIVYFDETSFEKLEINGKSIELAADSAEGVKFRNQIFMTEDAKKFILARELFYLTKNQDMVRDCASVAMAFVIFQSIYLLHWKYKMLAKVKPFFKALVYSGVAAVVFIAKRELMESYMMQQHYKADKVAMLEARYFTGAMEYYQKLIMRNKILHKLGFSKYFNKLGNEVSGIVFNYSAINTHVRLSRLMNPKGTT